MNDAPSGNLSVPKTDSDIFGSEAGMVKALASLRQSTLSLEEKNATRDLFLSYAGESDESKRNEIKRSIAETLKKDPGLATLLPSEAEAVPKAVVETPTVGGFGQVRPVPQFKVEEKVLVEEKKPEVKSEPTPVVTEIKPEAVPEPAATPTPAPVSGDAKNRITEIKHDINSRVGNPVNLINVDEKVGREYMSALLDAMKKAGQGGGESLTRLENAYQAALKVISEKGLGQNDVAPTPAPEVKEPEPVTPPPETPKVEEVVPIVPPPPPPIQSHGLYHRPTDELEAEENAAPKKPSGLGSLTSRLFKSDAPVEKSPAPQTTVASAPSIRKVSVADAATTAVEGKLKPLTETSNTLPEQMAEIKEKALEKEAIAKRPITDLKSPEVEAGLRHLLSEWTLFRKSGFFGTGPSGIDHPLYQKLSSLPMAAVVSGRFEGSTPEIKRSLSDYMSGWRYEQGIVHEMGETFDTYLRRVIRQILEKQRKMKEKG